MKKLYQPIKINQLELKNRIVMAPMGINNTENGFSTDRDVEFFRRRAKGGPGLIVYGNIQFDPIRYNPKSGARLSDAMFVPRLRMVTEAVHAEGCPIFAQLMHQGRYGSTKNSVGGELVAPSVVPTKFNGNEPPRALRHDEIAQFIEWQVTAAKLAVQAGFDGIEIETNSGYLFGQFFSPLTNKRKDEYGGSLENRCRFLVETLAALRAALGDGFPITVRVSGNDFVPGSCTNDDICDICALLDKTGYVDAISVTGGWHEAAIPLITMELPPANYAYLGKAIKQRVNCPVWQSNRMNIPVAEELVERGDVDMIVMARPLLAEPNLVALAQAGRLDEARPCIGCNAGCLDPCLKNQRVGCISNVECNHELDLMDSEGRLPSEVLSDHPQRILVIGAGVAGLEFARVAALRGHSVQIWEKRQKAGGQLKLAAAPPRRGDIALLGQWLERSCQRLGVNILYGWEATPVDVLAVKEDFDRVVIATGACPATPDIPIEEDAPVVQAWDVLDGTAKTGKRVVIIGGGAVGIETAFYLAEIGTITAEQLRFMMIFDVEPYEKLKQLLNRGSKQVSVVEMQKAFGKDINPGARWSMMARVRQLGISLISESKVTEIRRAGVLIERDGAAQLLPADSIVLATGAQPANALYEALRGEIAQLDIIGDAASVAQIADAIRAAYTLASRL